MAYNLCFICTKKIQGYIEFPTKQQSAAGTLCELLGLQLRDSTFGFGPKFQQTPYCPQCVNKMKGIHQLFNELREIEVKIENERIQVENQLMESVENRRILKNQDEDEFHAFDHFRDEVVHEIDRRLSARTRHQRRIIGGNTGRKLNKDGQPGIEKVVIQSAKRLKIDVGKSEAPITARKSTSGLRRKPRSRISARHQNEMKHQIDSDLEFPENVDNGDNTSSSSSEEPDVQELISNESDPLDTGLISIADNEDEDPHELEVDQNYSTLHDGIYDEVYRKGILIKSSGNGKRQCPYAPACDSTFEKNCEPDILYHIRISHEGKIPKDHLENKRLFKCKVCSKRYVSLTRLRGHYTKKHADHEWNRREGLSSTSALGKGKDEKSKTKNMDNGPGHNIPCVGRKKGVEWNHFKTVKAGDQVLSNSCLICKAEVSAQSTRMRKHLEKCRKNNPNYIPPPGNTYTGLPHPFDDI